MFDHDNRGLAQVSEPGSTACQLSVRAGFNARPSAPCRLLPACLIVVPSTRCMIRTGHASVEDQTTGADNSREHGWARLDSACAYHMTYWYHSGGFPLSNGAGMCQPTISAVYRTPALLEKVPILVLVKVSAVLYDFADTTNVGRRHCPTGTIWGTPLMYCVPGI